MARNTPPNLISYTESVWNTSTNTKSVTVPSFQAGDVLVALGGGETNRTLAVPTATGLTFASAVLNITASTCGTRIATATAAAGGTSVSVTMTSSSAMTYGFAVWVWRGSDGVGHNGEQHTTTHTVSVTPLDTHSAWMWGAFDFSAAAATNTFLPTQTNIDEQAIENAAYTAYVADLVDQASGSATAFGISAGGTVGTISLAVIEILGTTSGGGGGTTVKQLAALGVG